MIIQLERSIYLASRSPRRRELLTQLGVRFELLLFRAAPAADPDVDETPLAGEAPLAYVERVACAKAVAGWKRVLQRGLPRAVVLAADTTVALGERILGKPADRDEAAAMLAALSGRQHEVLTAVAVRNEAELACVVSRSEVEFRELSPREIAQYVATGECDDKAGAYGIQGRAEQFVASLRGSLSGVMGLPLGETARLLERIVAPTERRLA